MLDSLSFLVVQKLHDLVGSRYRLDVLRVLQIKDSCFDMMHPSMADCAVMSGKHNIFVIFIYYDLEIKDCALH